MRFKKNIIFLAVLSSILVWFFASEVEASLIDRLRGRTYLAPIETLAEGETATIAVVNWMIGIFWILAVGFVIWTAFLYLSAGGNEEKISEAKKRLVYALIAAAIALLSTGIGTITENLLQGQTGNACRNYTTQAACEQAGCRWRWVLFTGYRCR